MKLFKYLAGFVLLSISQQCFSQKNTDSARFKVVAAGSEYNKSPLYRWLWGNNYRKEWIKPVSFPVAYLDTLAGGVTEVKEGGSHQSKSLHIKAAHDKQYALRSVDKTLDKLIPPIFKNTFIDDIVGDAISMSHPYAALAVPQMADAAGIPHMIPRYYYIPEQPAVDSLKYKYGNSLYLFEQRPSGNWSDAPNMGNFKKFIGSDELLDKLYADHNITVDQPAFAKARLFDMLIGDWDRHWDQWKWGTADKGGVKSYEPIPTDRDQAFSTYDGILLRGVIAAAGMKFLQPFKSTIKDINTLNTAKNLLDRFFTNEVTLAQWQQQAKDIQSALTNPVIESSVKQLPPEIFAISGNELTAKLISRNSHLAEYATKYYYFLAREVEIVGSKENEYFDISRLNDNETRVNVFKIEKDGSRTSTPYYSRTFNTSETKEIRLYGLSGNDVFSINGKVRKGIKIRIIGGDQKDSIIDHSNLKIHVYDDANNTFVKGSKTKLHIADSTDHTFFFDTYQPDKKGTTPELSYDNNDRLYVGLGFNYTHHHWRKLPYAFKQGVAVHYSISQKAFNFLYQGIFPKLIGKWDLLLQGDYDLIRWTNFYGIGNNTVLTSDDHNYNRLRSKEVLGSLGIERKTGKSTIDISGVFEGTQIINDTARFVSKIFSPNNPETFRFEKYGGGQLNYKVVSLNDSVVPTKGISFFGKAGYVHSLSGNNAIGRFSGRTELFIPIAGKFSLALRAAAATVTGEPAFYQLPNIGGAESLRGFIRERFRGTTSFTNSNELRFITDFRTHLVNGKIGLMVFYDQGRIWQKNEDSKTWHTDYGTGLLIAPFNRILANVTYGISNEKKLVQLRLVKSI